MAGLTKEQRAAKKAEAERAKAIELSGLSAEEYDALSDEDRAALLEKADKQFLADDVDDGLIEMTRDGETLRLDVGCVAEHERLGWTISE